MGESFRPNREPGPVFPGGIDPADQELIRKQCEIQNATSSEQLEGFAAAYLKTKQLTENQDFWQKLDPVTSEKLILELAALVERVNISGYRRVPASFRDGSLALDASKIEQAIQSFVQGFVSFLEDPTEDERLNAALLYAEFEKIHPFVDGNGRVGDLLWKILETRKRGEWPLELPPNVFGEKRSDETFGSEASESETNAEMTLAELQDYLNRQELDLPILRRNLDIPGNLKWLNQNLGIRNSVPDAVIRAIRRELRKSQI